MEGAYWGDLCDNPEPHVGHEYDFEGHTVLCEGRLEDARQPESSAFGHRVNRILEESQDTYAERNAIYRDNFRTVGRVMEALFPEGRPGLKTAADYDRWHIFELLIVKLTRYVADFDNPHADSLLDQIVYIGILGGLDEELYERRGEKTGEEADAIFNWDATKGITLRDIGAEPKPGEIDRSILRARQIMTGVQRAEDIDPAKTYRDAAGGYWLRHTAWPKYPAEYGTVQCSNCDGMVHRDPDTEWTHEDEQRNPSSLPTFMELRGDKERIRAEEKLNELNDRDEDLLEDF